jgi:hypothetical protein
VGELRKEIHAIQTKLQRILDGYLEQDIEREVYREKKAKLLSEKKSLEEKIIALEQKHQCWLEPLQSWIKDASALVKIAHDGNLFSKKVAAEQAFGSNLSLHDRVLRGNPLPPYFAALRAAEFVGEKSESSILVGDRGVEPLTSSTSMTRSTN